MHIIIWILGALSGYILWGKITWLSIVVIVLTLSYSVHGDEQHEYNTKGVYSNITATRLMLTFTLVVAIFIFSLFKINISDKKNITAEQTSSFTDYSNSEKPFVNEQKLNISQKIEDSKINVNQNNDCNRRATIFSEKFKQENSINHNINYFILSKYHFNNQMNACLSENGFVFSDHGGEGTYLQIVNIDNNSFVLRSSQNAFGNDIKPNNGIVSYDDFLLQEKNLMLK